MEFEEFFVPTFFKKKKRILYKMDKIISQEVSVFICKLFALNISLEFIFLETDIYLSFTNILL